MKPALVIMYALSAILPTIGFVRLWIRAERDLIRAEKIVAERGNAAATFGDFNAANADITAGPRAVKSQLVWDSIFVFVGLGLGAAASILSLD